MSTTALFLVLRSANTVSRAVVFNSVSFGLYSVIIFKRAMRASKLLIRLSKLICEAEMLSSDSSSGVEGSSFFFGSALLP